MSLQTASTNLARIAQKSERNGVRRGWAATVMTPCGVVNCKVFGPQGPSLTNRMSELLTYGSVGGGGSNPAPYPAHNAGRLSPFRFAIGVFRSGVCESSAVCLA